MVIKYNRISNLHVELKAELLDEEMIDLLKEAKTDFIEIGIQSANKKTLQLINRHFDPDIQPKRHIVEQENIPLRFN